MLTTCEIPEYIKEIIEDEVVEEKKVKKGASQSEIIRDILEKFLNIAKKPLNKDTALSEPGEDNVYISLVLPTDLNTRTKIFAANSNISAGSVIRHALIKKYGSKQAYGRQQRKKVNEG